MQLTSYYFLVIAGLIHPRWTDSLVVTKYDVNIFLQYYRLLVVHYNGTHDENPFREQKNLTQYCHRLRHAHKVKIAKTTREFWAPPARFLVYAIHENETKMERDNGRIQLMKFRIENTSKVLTLQTFSCLNNKKELKWLVTPAFVPDSAFLFSIQSFSAQSSQRSLSGQSEMIASFEGIIDKLASRVTGEFINGPDEFIRVSNSNETDSICDLNAMLQYRLCAIYSRVFTTRGLAPREGIINDVDRTYAYEDSPASRYLYPDEKCVPVALTFRETTRITRKMLHCFINHPVHGPGSPFFLSQHPLNPSQIFYIRWANESYIIVTYTQVPLLTHIGVYGTILHNFMLV